MYNSIYPIIGNQIDLPFYLSGIGISDPEYHVRREDGLVSHQILFVDSGECILEIDGKKFELTAGSLFYITPKVPHEYYPKADKLSTYWVVFRGKYLSELMRVLGFAEAAVKESANIGKLKKLFDMLFSAAADPLWGSEKCSKLLYDYILTARKLFAEVSDKFAESPVESAVIYINEHFSEDITLGELAGVSGISLQHFCRLFKAKMGMRPLDYVARLRISQAKSQLESTKRSIAEIGEMVGYQNPTYFGMVFRKYEGVSPSEYRKYKGSRQC